MALPVNFGCLGDDVYFRTDESMAVDVTAQGLVGFEVDRIDDAMSEGWSVLVTGRAARVDASLATDELATLSIEPWAGGSRDVLVQIHADDVSGRVIVLAAT
jgi:nitroimidazol reductase NimA-like FMN-containing flavoprotein (pyridoxamine 5'-phosphate oxidase superfamily)